MNCSITSQSAGLTELAFLALLQGGLDPLFDALVAADGVDAGLLAADDSGADADAWLCGGESFSRGTKVLLASGAAIPISQLKVGDKVLATNVKTGKTSPEPVTALLSKHDTDKYNLRIRSRHKTAIIHTTRKHLFFDLTRNKWVKAASLSRGDHLRTNDGTTVTVIGGRTPARVAGWMWDLTVPGGDDHDFYIAVFKTAILVHNCPVQYKPLPKWKQCIISITSALSIAHKWVSGGVDIERPPVSGYVSEYRYPENPGGAPPTPGEGGGGGETGEDEC